MCFFFKHTEATCLESCLHGFITLELGHRQVLTDVVESSSNKDICHLRAPIPHGTARRVEAFCLLVSHLAASSQGPPRQHTALYCSCLLLAVYSFLPQLIPLRCHMTFGFPPLGGMQVTMCAYWRPKTPVWLENAEAGWIPGLVLTQRHAYISVCSLFFFLFFCLHHNESRILDPQPGTEPMPPAVEVWNSNHWTNREIPVLFTTRMILNMSLNVSFIQIHWVIKKIKEEHPCKMLVCGKSPLNATSFLLPFLSYFIL